LSALGWMLALASLVGVWINIRWKHVASFWIWSVTNAGWTGLDLAHELPAQAALQASYFLLSLYGIWQWGFRDRAPSPSKEAG
jgi:hypothetical protein